jgi:formylglycine-generating enzyme required for sulfatase activity
MKKIVLKKLNSWLLAGPLTILTGVNPAPAQIPPTLGIDISNGVKITVAGTTGSVFVIQSTGNLAQSNSWSSLAFLQISSSNHLFIDTAAPAAASRFYRARFQSPPTNMVFIPANTFLMGSPTNEAGHEADESPQTLVSLSHGFWIGKYEVTQAEFFAVTGDNPNSFPGDPNRPVESVSFFAASNYCVLRTEQDLAAGRIPSGTHYRLPTEAEWECAARAGTSTRFYYGEDPLATNLINHAWYGAIGGATTHPVGQKEPNAWGLYDLEGNVWEWCQDWYGPYPGGSETDPQGPASNTTGVKVIRGGAWESFDADCRSARRSTEPVSPFISDFIIGFRVVLAIDP